jgi:exonuclease SbcD
MIGHLSDTHLGWYSRDGRAVERENDYYNAFKEAVEIFMEEHVDLVIHSGDILDTPRPYGTAVKALMDGALELSRKGIPFLFTFGEHDLSNIPSTPYPILLEKLEIGKRVGDGKPHEVKGLIVVGLHRHKKYEQSSLLEKLDKIGEALTQYSGKRILVLHQGLRDIAGPWAEISLAELPEGFHYYAMGHYHKYIEKEFGSGLLSYPGPTHWVDADDPDECGVNIIDLSGDIPTIHWQRLNNVRPKLRKRITSKKVMEYLTELTKLEYKLKPCIWLEVETENRIDDLLIEEKLKEKYIVQEIRPVLPLTIREKIPDLKESTLDMELRRLAVEVLESNERNASFVLDELLPLLADAEKRNEAADAVWNYYMRGEWYDKKS